MSIKIGQRKRRESYTDALQLPMNSSLKLRYRKVQQKMDDKQTEKTLHDLARQRLEALLDEVEPELDAS